MADTDERERTDDRAGERGDERRDQQGGKPGGLKKKLGDKKETIIMIATVLGLLVAYFMLRNSSAGAATGTGGYPTGSTGADGTTDGTTDPTAISAGDANQLNKLSQRIGNLQTKVANQQAARAGLAAKLKLSNQNVSKLRHELNQANAGHKKTSVHFIYGPKAKGLKYLLNRATGAIYQVMPNGQRYKLSRVQYVELGRPKTIGYGKAPKPAKPPKRHKPKPPGHVPHHPVKKG